MAPYILKKRNLIHIIDIKETLRGLFAGSMVVEKIAGQGKYVLFVGTKNQARQITREAAEHCEMPYVVERWPGGLMTNYNTIRSRLRRLEELEDLERTGRINEFSKKMISSFRREARKIERNLGGVRNMDRLPGLLVLVDPRQEDIAVKEARKLHIPTVACLDTDADPDQVDIPIPANDDSIRSIEIFVRLMADAVIRGREQAGKKKEEKSEAPQKPGKDSPETADPETVGDAEGTEENNGSAPAEETDADVSAETQA